MLGAAIQQYCQICGAQESDEAEATGSDSMDDSDTESGSQPPEVLQVKHPAAVTTIAAGSDAAAAVATAAIDSIAAEAKILLLLLLLLLVLPSRHFHGSLHSVEQVSLVMSSSTLNTALP